MVIISFSGDIIENLIFFASFGSKSWIGIWPVITTLFPCTYADLSDFIKNSDLSSTRDSISCVNSSVGFSVKFGNISNVNGKTTTVCRYWLSIIFTITGLCFATLLAIMEYFMTNSCSSYNTGPT